MFSEVFHSFVLAQVFGLYLLVMVVVLLSRASFYKELVQRMEPHSPGLIVGGSFGLMLGLLLVVIHNIWVLEPRVAVTIVSWIILIKSILWLAFPECMTSATKKVYSGIGYYIMILIFLVVGIFFMTKGFYLYL